MELSIHKFLEAIKKRYWVILVIPIVALSISSIYAYEVFSPHYETRMEHDSALLYTNTMPGMSIAPWLSREIHYGQ